MSLNRIQRARKKAFDDMFPETREAAVKLEDRFKKITRGNILSRHKMGEMINQVLAGEATYGANAVDLLASYVGAEPRQLYDFAKLASAFTQDELEELVSVMPVHVRWYHYLLISRAEPQDRPRWLAVVTNEELSARDLEQRMRVTWVTPTKAKGGGRKPTPPKSPWGGVQQILNLMNKIQRKRQQWTEALFDEVDVTSVDNIDGILHQKLIDARDTMVSAQGTLSQLVDRATVSIERVQAIIESREASGK